ncbi:hypothetical protein [Dyadobacter sp. CY312]|uniref:hypothetical protein n=1 Tax=Dyadobacter sp. CY312 TaxID=2907303 RepID=UPI001F482ADC|nr:hypothetical protein [Dyadobacter sp. CY312]MCE7039207.1 hypothetical protein [Dyadobacter sp. CY312]
MENKVWLVYTPGQKPMPLDDETLNDDLVGIRESEDEAIKLGFNVVRETIESIRAFRSELNIERAVSVQHAAFTDEKLAQKLAKYLSSPDVRPEVTQVSEDELQVELDQYKEQLTSTVRPFTVSMKDGMLFESCGYESPYSGYVTRLMEPSHGVTDEYEWLAGTFWAKDFIKAEITAEKYWDKLVKEGKLSVPLQLI